MMRDPHREVEQLVDEAEALRTGRPAEAAERYRRAAALEDQAFALVPTEHTRTRGILAVSVVSLYWRAQAFADVVQQADRFLASMGLPAFARDKLISMRLD